MSSKKKNEDEFKPTVIEPIEGQICYDELLVPQKEEEKKVDNFVAEGQMDFWSIDPRKSDDGVKNLVKNEEISAKSSQISTKEESVSSDRTAKKK